jgi:hypothetical protein
MLMKLIGFNDSEFEAISNEYDNVGAAVDPERHT